MRTISTRNRARRPADQAFRSRAVQYVARPTYPWKKLPKEEPGVHENAVNPVPDPNGWFHARIVVTKEEVTVFLNQAQRPCLVVDRITDQEKGGVGLWLDVFDGKFANLQITPKQVSG